jgi:NarL family two-component system response regulator LiaR
MKSVFKIRVLLVDDHRMVRDGLRVFLSVFDDIKVVGEAQDGSEVLGQCALTKPDVILMDILMPGEDGPTATALVRQEYPNIQVIALTSFVDPKLVQRALEAGAISYLLKDVHADKLALAVREAYQGRGSIDSAAAKTLVSEGHDEPSTEYGLTAREAEILELMVAGKTNKEIALTLTVSPGTVRFHVSNVLSKLGVKNRTEAVSLAWQDGLVEGE